jgi:hypothetical protein
MRKADALINQNATVPYLQVDRFSINSTYRKQEERLKKLQSPVCLPVGNQNRKGHSPRFNDHETDVKHDDDRRPSPNTTMK